MQYFRVYSILFAFQMAYSIKFYIHSIPQCSLNTCNGSSLYPFYDLWHAINSTSQFSNPAETFEFLFLKPSDSFFHYLLLSDSNISSGSYSLPKDLFFEGNIIFRPLFCGEDSDPLLNGLCYDENQQVTIYLKTENIKLAINGSLSVKNVIIDGSEDVTKLNDQISSSNLLICNSSRIKCCDPQVFVDVLCLQNITYGMDSSGALISIWPSVYGDPNMTIINSKVRNNYLKAKYSLIEINDGKSILIQNVTLENNYFAHGFVYANQYKISTVSTIVEAKNLTFFNYKNWPFNNPGSILLMESNSLNINANLETVILNAINIKNESSLVKFSRSSQIFIQKILAIDLEIDQNSNLIDLTDAFHALRLSNIYFISLSIKDWQSSIFKIWNNSSLELEDFWMENSTLNGSIAIIEDSTLTVSNFTMMGVVISDKALVFDLRNTISNLSQIRIYGSSLQESEYVDTVKFFRITGYSIFNLSNIHMINCSIAGDFLNSDKYTVVNLKQVRLYNISNFGSIKALIIDSLSRLRIQEFELHDSYLNNSIIIRAKESDIILTNSSFQNLLLFQTNLVYIVEGTSISIKNISIADAYFKTKDGTSIIDLDMLSSANGSLIGGVFKNLTLYGPTLIAFHQCYSTFANNTFESITINSEPLGPNHGGAFSYQISQDAVYFEYSNYVSISNISFFNITHIILGVQHAINLRRCSNVKIAHVLFDTHKTYQLNQNDSHAKFIFGRGLYGDYMDVENMTIQNCYMEANMMGIAMYQTTAILRMKTVLQMNNHIINGILLFISGSKVEISDMRWTGNSFKYTGFVLDRKNFLKISNFRIDNNIASVALFELILESNVTLINVTILNNNITNGGSLINGLISSRYVLSDIYSQDNIFLESATLIRIQNSFLDLQNFETFNNTLDETSSIINIIKSNSVKIANVILNKDQKKLSNSFSNQNINSESDFFCFVFLDSRISLSNIILKSTPGLMYSLSSNVTIENLQSKTIAYFRNFRKFITIFQSTITFRDVSIHEDKNNYKLDTNDRWIYCYQSDLYMVKLSVVGISNSNGQFIVMTGGSLSMIYSSIYHTNFINSAPLILASEASLIHLHLIEFVNSSYILTGNLISSLEIKDVNISSSYNFDQAIDLSDCNKVIIINCLMSFIPIANPLVANFLIQVSGKISMLELDSINVNNSYTRISPLILDISSSECTYFIQNSTFSGNFAKDGSGAIKIINSLNNTFVLRNIDFNNNTAHQSSSSQGGRGGALFLSTANNTNALTIFRVENCTFRNNHALYFGGAIYVYGRPPLINNDSIFENNTVVLEDKNHLNHIGSQAISLVFSRFLKICDSNFEADLNVVNSISFNDIGSGIYSLKDSQLILIDMYCQVVLDDNTSTITFVPEKNLTTSITSFQVVQGKFDLDNLLLTAKIEERKLINVTIDGMNKFTNVKLQGSDDISKFQIEVNFRDCTMGEQLNSSLSCEECSQGTTHFELTPNYTGSCSICDSKQICRGGGMVGPAEGFYRPNRDSDLFLKCSDEDVCLGARINNEFSYTGFCASGHEGILCSKCVSGMQKFRESLGCFHCKGNVGIVFVLIIVYGIQIAVMFSIWKKIFFTNFDCKQGMIAKNFIAKFRILVVHQQAISLIFRIRIRWPDALRYLIEIQKSFLSSNSDVFGLECLLRYDDSNLNVRYVKLILINFFPIFFFILFLGIVILYFWRKQTRNFKLLYEQNLISFCFSILWYLSQMWVIEENLSMFSCLNLNRSDDPRFYLESSKEIECWDRDHKYFTLLFSVPLLIVWIFVLPYIFMKRALTHAHFFKPNIRFSMLLTSGFRTKKKNWEITRLCRNFAIVILISFGGYGSPELELYLLIYIIIAFFLVLERASPYNLKRLQDLESISLGIILMLTMMGIFVNQFSPSLWVQILWIVLYVLVHGYFYYALFFQSYPLVVLEESIHIEYPDVAKPQKKRWISLLVRSSSKKSNVIKRNDSNGFRTELIP